jgi:hypothetical protein
VFGQDYPKFQLFYIIPCNFVVIVILATTAPLRVRGLNISICISEIFIMLGLFVFVRIEYAPDSVDYTQLPLILIV